MLEDNELQLQDVVRVHPVFCCLANEVLLLASRGGIALDRIAARAYNVVEPGKLHHVRVVVVLEEGLAFESRGEDGLEDPAGAFLLQLAFIRDQLGVNSYIMLLDDLLEARVVELGELGQVMDICDDIAQVLLEQIKVLLVGIRVLRRRLLCASNGIVDLFL